MRGGLRQKLLLSALDARGSVLYPASQLVVQ